MKPARWLEVTVWAAGLALLGCYAALRASAERERTAGVQAFQVLRHAAHAKAAADLLHHPSGRVDQSLWSTARILAFRRATLHEAPEGVLRIPALHLAVPIYPGTGASQLDRGVGHVDGTAPLDSRGNAAIAGHRDGFFRSLQRIRPGETLSVETLGGTRRFRVLGTRIVAPSDVSVLAPTAVPTVTLITCYPFYFVGPAPRRFIVRATIVSGARPAAGERTADNFQRQE